MAKAKAKARTKKAPIKAAKKAPKKAARKAAKKTTRKTTRKTAKKGAIAAQTVKLAIEKRRAAKSPAAEIRLPLTAPVRVAPTPRPMSPAQRMPMPVAGDRPIAPIQLRQPSLFQRELPADDDTK